MVNEIISVDEEKLRKEIKNEIIKDMTKKYNTVKTVLRKVAEDRYEIEDEVMTIFDADLSEKYDIKLIKEFIKGVSYDDEDKERHYREAHRLRAKGMPILTDTKNHTYKLAGDKSELDKAERVERKRRNKKIARAYILSALNPEKIEEVIAEKTNNEIEFKKKGE